MSIKSVSYSFVLIVAFLLSTLVVVGLRIVRLPPMEEVVFYSGYGTVDHRLLLLGYAAILIALLASPLVAVSLFGRLRGGSSPVTTPEAEENGNGSGRFVSTGRAWVVTLALLPVLTVLFLGPWIAYGPLDGHELVHLGYLSEIGHGRVLNLDTRITYGPLLGYAIYGFMWLVEFSLVGFRLYWNVTALLFFLALVGLVLPRFRSRILFTFFFLCALTYTTGFYYLQQTEGIRWGWANPWRHGWAPLAILALSGPILRSSQGWPRVVAGALPVLAGFFAQETLAPGAVALGALVLLGSRTSPRRTLVRDLSLALVGAGIGFVIAAGPALLRGSPLEFVQATWHIPRLFLKGAGATAYPLPFTGEWIGAGSVVYVLFPGAVLALLLGSWLSALQGRDAVPALIGVYAALSYVTVLVRADLYHLHNVLLAPLLLAFLVLDARLPRLTRRWGRWLSPAVFLVLLLSMIWVPPGLAGLGRAVATRVSDPWPAPPEGWERVPGPRGGIWTPPRKWVRLTVGTQPFDPAAHVMMRQLTGGSEAVITNRNASLHYFLSDVPAATPYTDISSQCLSTEDRAFLQRGFQERAPGFIFQDLTVAIRNEITLPEVYEPVLEYAGFSALLREDLLAPTAMELGAGASPIEEPWALSLMAGILVRQGNPKAAINLLQTAVNRNPADAVLPYQLGKALQEAGHPTEAAAQYRHALRLDPLHFFSYYRLSEAHWDAGDSTLAQAALEEGARLFPENPLLLEQLGQLRRGRRDFPGAIEAWQEALRAQPNSAELAFSLGTTLIQAGRSGEALPVLEDLVDRYPTNSSIWVALGIARSRGNQKEEARDAFREAIRLEPAAPEPYFRLAQLHLTAGETARAIEWLRRYLAQDSESQHSEMARALIEKLGTMNQQ